MDTELIRLRHLVLARVGMAGQHVPEGQLAPAHVFVVGEIRCRVAVRDAPEGTVAALDLASLRYQAPKVRAYHVVAALPAMVLEPLVEDTSNQTSTSVRTRGCDNTLGGRNPALNITQGSCSDDPRLAKLSCSS